MFLPKKQALRMLQDREFFFIKNLQDSGNFLKILYEVLRKENFLCRMVNPGKTMNQKVF